MTDTQKILNALKVIHEENKALLYLIGTEGITLETFKQMESLWDKKFLEAIGEEFEIKYGR